jgi:hypothetical protein
MKLHNFFQDQLLGLSEKLLWDGGFYIHLNSFLSCVPQSVIMEFELKGTLISEIYVILQ